VTLRATRPADFHVHYNSIKCESVTTVVYQLNQSAAHEAAGVAAGDGSGATGAGALQQRRATTTTHHDEAGGGGGDTLAGACTWAQALDDGSDACLRESSLLFLLLMLGTVWLGLSLYNFTKTSVDTLLVPRLFAAAADIHTVAKKLKHCLLQRT